MTKRDDRQLGMFDTPEEYSQASQAVFSDCGKYRYLLFRQWAPSLPTLTICMLNPSDADLLDLDPTCTRVKVFAQDWGFGSMKVVNAFAFVATEPTDMKAAADPIGPENDQYIRQASREAEFLVAAWGPPCTHRNREPDVLRVFAEEAREVHAIHVTEGGHPGHPLYLPGDLKPRLFQDQNGQRIPWK